MTTRRYSWIASCFVAAISLGQSLPLQAQPSRLSLRPIADGLRGESVFQIENQGRTVGSGQVRQGAQPVMVAVQLKIAGLDDVLIFRLEKDAEFVRSVLQLGELRGEIRADQKKLEELSQRIGQLQKAGRSEDAKAVGAELRSIIQVRGDLETIRQRLASSPSAASALNTLYAVSHEHRARNLTEFALQKLTHLTVVQTRYDTPPKSPRPVSNRSRVRSANPYKYVQAVDCYNEENWCAFWFFINVGACSDMWYWCSVEEWFGPNSWFTCRDLWASCTTAAYYGFGWCLCTECPENYNCPWPG